MLINIVDCIELDDWKRSYNLIKHSPLFAWVPSLVDGLKAENMNLDPTDADATKNNDRRTTTLNATDRTKLVVEEVDDNEEVEKRNDRLLPFDIENI